MTSMEGPDAAARNAGSPARFDYEAEAELFPSRGKFRRAAIGYKRFTRAAEAIRFAIEDLPPNRLLGAFIEVDEGRYDSAGIRRLYDSAEFPLPRRAAAR